MSSMEVVLVSTEYQGHSALAVYSASLLFCLFDSGNKITKRLRSVPNCEGHHLGVEAAGKLELEVIGVLTGGTTREELEEAGAIARTWPSCSLTSSRARCARSSTARPAERLNPAVHQPATWRRKSTRRST